MKMFRTKTALPLFALVLLAANTIALAGSNAQYESDVKQSAVTFLAVGKPGFLRIRGEGGAVSGIADVKEGTVQGAFKVNMADFKTGIDMRDEHMKSKYLEVEKFPEAILQLDPIPVKLAGKETVKFTGQFTLKGKTKPIKGEATLQTEDATGRVAVEATFSILLTDYDVGIPSHLGIKVAEEVEVAVKFGATKKPATAH